MQNDKKGVKRVAEGTSRSVTRSVRTKHLEEGSNDVPTVSKTRGTQVRAKPVPAMVAKKRKKTKVTKKIPSSGTGQETTRNDEDGNDEDGNEEEIVDKHDSSNEEEKFSEDLSSTVSVRVNEPKTPMDRLVSQPTEKTIVHSPIPEGDDGTDDIQPEIRSPTESVKKSPLLSRPLMSRINPRDSSPTTVPRTIKKMAPKSKITIPGKVHDEEKSYRDSRQGDRTDTQGGSTSISKNDEISILKKMMRSLNNKMDKVLEKVGKCESELAEEAFSTRELSGIIHSLLSHLEGGNMPQSMLNNKLVPLKRLLVEEGHHKRCVGKHVADRLVKACGCTKLNKATLNEFAAVMRTVFYSSNSGGRKEYKGNNDEMQHLHVTLKKSLTYILINTIQGKEEVGQVVLSQDGVDHLIPKPFWMRTGFTKSKDIKQFYNGKKNVKKGKVDPDESDDNFLQHHIIKKINDTHNLSFNKIRDRVRVDGMKEFWYLFEEHNFQFDEDPKERDSMFDLSKLPVVNVTDVPNSKLSGVLGKIWEGLKEIVGDEFLYLVHYDVRVEGKAGSQNISRIVDLVSISAVILMRLTISTNVNQLLMYHKNMPKAIFTLAEILRHLLQMQREGKLWRMLEELKEDDDEYHIVNMMQDIRPTKEVTRKEMLHNYTINIDEAEYDKLHVVFESDDDKEEPRRKENVSTLAELNSDDDDEFGEELDEAVDFLLN